MAMDWAELQARKALQPYRRGSQINAGCVEIYDAVAEVIRAAYKRGETEGIAAVRSSENANTKRK